jgi:hypothetical protein
MSRVTRKLVCSAFFGLVTFLTMAPVAAQEMEPRRWTHLPTGLDIVAAGYAHTDATIPSDPVIRLENATVEIDTWLASYIHTFALLDKSARIEIRQPWQSGQWTGTLNGTPTTVEREGWGDTIARFAVNLIGAPPLDGKAYRDYRATADNETIVGAALMMQLPTGEYMKDKLINLGANRFTFRPQLGAVHRMANWSFELTGAVAFFTDNDEFFNGNKLKQDPLFTLDSHVVYTFRSGFWSALSVGLAAGGETSVNGNDKNDRREDVGWALSAGYPITNWLGVKVAYIDSRRRARVGNDSETIAVGLTASW